MFDPNLTISPYACVDRHIINVRGILDVSEKVFAIGCVDEPEELGDGNEREPKFISGGSGALLLKCVFFASVNGEVVPWYCQVRVSLIFVSTDYSFRHTPVLAK